ncbi:hypothetical protein DPMN_180626 [Dreissena polymorpha]|uniref:Uncharacterized protein n=1 Tax=Dreissena polymorpha TaxID=45954 RepID=A0A9D4EJH6_DREPO|nr:hypothetical protein DPMN_180626 [Dreissena polymorpha]
MNTVLSMSVCRMADWSVYKGSPGADILSSLSCRSSNRDQSLSTLHRMSSFMDSHLYTSSAMYDENTFCTSDNLEDCITQLNQV